MIDWVKLSIIGVLVFIFPFTFITEHPEAIFLIWLVVFVAILIIPPKKKSVPEPIIRNTLIIPDGLTITINVTKDERRKIKIRKSDV